MPSLEEVRKWLRGEDVEGLPPRSIAWGDRSKARLVKDDNAFAQKMRKEANYARKEKLARYAGHTMKDGAVRFTVSEDGTDAVLLFGKHNGSNISDLVKSNPGYLEWVKTQEFPEALLEIIEHQFSVLVTALHDDDSDSIELFGKELG